MISLLQYGDIESNPGPVYNIEKVALDSFHHGDSRFGATAGVQCACNSLLVPVGPRFRTVEFGKRMIWIMFLVKVINLINHQTL